jgi:hypothetical protein
MQLTASLEGGLAACRSCCDLRLVACVVPAHVQSHNIIVLGKGRHLVPAPSTTQLGLFQSPRAHVGCQLAPGFLPNGNPLVAAVWRSVMALNSHNQQEDEHCAVSGCACTISTALHVLLSVHLFKCTAFSHVCKLLALTSSCTSTQGSHAASASEACRAGGQETQHATCSSTTSSVTTTQLPLPV